VGSDEVRYKCPYPGCSFESDTYAGLKGHYSLVHRTDECPVCRRRFKSLSRHLAMMAESGDIMHAVHYALGRRSRKYKACEVYRMSVRIAEEVCRCD